MIRIPFKTKGSLTEPFYFDMSYINLFQELISTNTELQTLSNPFL